jgi:hypothetical protein
LTPPVRQRLGNAIATRIRGISEMYGGKVIDVVAFFDTKDFDAFWSRVTPG